MENAIKNFHFVFLNTSLNIYLVFNTYIGIFESTLISNFPLDLFELLCAEVGEDVTLRRREDFEGHGAMVILQRRHVVVPDKVHQGFQTWKYEMLFLKDLNVYEQ